MLLVILLQVWHGYGKTLGTFSLAENSLFLQLLIVVKLAVISALHQMALVTIPPEHAVWMCFVSGIFIFHNFKGKRTPLLQQLAFELFEVLNLKFYWTR